MATVSSCIHKRVQASPEELVEAMNGKLSLEDRFLLDQSLEEYRLYQPLMTTLDKEIQADIQKHFLEENKRLQTIPGVSEACAATILAEIGSAVDAFKSNGHLASWSGPCPGSYESAGKMTSSHTTTSNRYIKHALTLAGLTAGRSKDLAFSSFYDRISQRGSKMKAVVACAHKLLRIIYKLLTTLQPYQKEKALGLRQQV